MPENIDFTSMPKLERNFVLDITKRAEGQQTNDRTIEFSCSSGNLIDRHWLYEQLLHGTDNIVTKRFDGMPLLADHDPCEQIGVIEGFRIADDKLFVTARFSKNPEAEEVYVDVLDGIKRNVSIGYVVHSAKLSGMQDDKEIIVVDKWEPMEISVVSVPADPSVGFGRSADNSKFYRSIIQKENEEQTMPGTENQNGTPITGGDNREVLEQRRVAEITALAKEHNQNPDWAVRSDVSIDAYKSFLLGQRKATQAINTESTDAVPHGTAKEEYSIVRAIRSQLMKENSFERELSSDLQRRSGYAHKSNSIILPFGLETRGDTLVAGTANEGKEFVPTNLKGERLIDSLEAKTISGRVGVQMLNGLVGITDIPRITSNLNPTFKGEVVAADKLKPSTDYIRFEPKRLPIKVPLSKVLLMNGGFDIESFIKGKIERALRRVVDHNLLYGAGTTAPVGILTKAGIHQISGVDYNYATACNLEALVLDSDVESDNMFYLMRASAAGVLKGRTKATGFPPFLIENKQHNGYEYIATSLMGATDVAFGDFTRAILATFGQGIEIVVDEYTQADEGIVNIIATIVADCGLEHDEAIALAENFS